MAWRHDSEPEQSQSIGGTQQPRALDAGPALRGNHFALAQAAAAVMAAIFRRDVEAAEWLQAEFDSIHTEALAWKLLALDLLIAQSVRDDRLPEDVAQEFASLLAAGVDGP